MPCKEAEGITAEFYGLLSEVTPLKPDDAWARVASWLEGISDDCHRHATRHVIWETRNGRLGSSNGVMRSVINAEVANIGTIMSDKHDQSTRIDNKGGNISSSNIGTGAKVTGSTLQTMQEKVSNASKIDQAGKDLFATAFAEISKIEKERIRNAANQELESLLSELESDEPEETLVRKTLNGLQAFAEYIPILAAIQDWITQTWSWAF